MSSTSLHRIAFWMFVFATSGLAQAATPQSIDPKRLSGIVRTLASDEFQGRAPGTTGETKTIAYLTERFAQLGLEPGGENGGWTQTVPIVRTQIDTPRRSASPSAASRGR